MNPNFGQPVSVPLQHLRLRWPVAFAVSTYPLKSPQIVTLNLPQPSQLGDSEVCREVAISLLPPSPAAPG